MFGNGLVSSFSFIAFVAVIVVLVLLVTRRSLSERRSVTQIVARALLVLYLGLIIGATFSPQPGHGWGIVSEPGGLKIAPNQVPFRTIAAMFRYSSALTIVRELGGNIVVFMPFGVLLGLVFPSLATWRRIALAGVLFSASIELGQLVVSLSLGFTYRYTDIDDVILNVVGVLLGFALDRYARRRSEPADADRGAEPA